MTTAEHGEARNYWAGCRCDDCRRAHSDYSRARRDGDRPDPLVRWERTGNLRWFARAACRNHPTDLWFANNGRKPYMKSNREAVAICDTCPVRADCLEYALELPTPWHGIFGGHNPAERIEIYKQRHNRRP